MMKIDIFFLNEQKSYFLVDGLSFLKCCFAQECLTLSEAMIIESINHQKFLVSMGNQRFDKKVSIGSVWIVSGSSILCIKYMWLKSH